MIVEADSATRAALSSGPVEPLGLRHLLPLAALLLVGGLTLLPTVVGVRDGNGFDTLPLVELAGGAHDLRWLPVQLSDAVLRSLFVVALVAPLVAVGGALVVGADVVGAVRARRPWRAVLPPAVVLALCLAVLVELVALVPLIGWWLD